MKFVIIVAAMLMSVGCASKSSVSALSARVDAQETDIKTIKADHETLMSNQEALKSDIAGLEAKMDAAFLKKSAK